MVPIRPRRLAAASEGSGPLRRRGVVRRLRTPGIEDGTRPRRRRSPACGGVRTAPLALTAQSEHATPREQNTRAERHGPTQTPPAIAEGSPPKRPHLPVEPPSGRL